MPRRGGPESRPLPEDAPGRKGRLTAVTVQYKIVGDPPTAVLKIWGYD